MRAVVIREPGGPEVLEVQEVPTPEPSRGQVRVRVRATAVNRADLLQRMGVYPAPPGAPRNIPGLEIAGEVDAVGEDVSGLARGDRVFGLVGGGGYAERIVTHERELARIPEGMPFSDAAAIPEAFITAWDAMIEQGRLSAGLTVLVHAAGSGVGTAGVQVAAAAGARSLGTVRTPQKIGRLRELGLKDGLVVEGGKFADDVLARTEGRGVDVVLDLVGGAYVPESLACLATGGRIVVVGTMGGIRADVDLAMLMRKRATIRGTMMRSRPLEEKILAAGVLRDHIVPLLAAGALRPVVDRVLPLARVADAHRLMQNSDTFGKLVLDV
jgi:NADPH2:quinone reductase